jgi:hypothetical protein
MRIVLVVTTVALLLLAPIALAEEPTQIRLVTGKLTAYGFASVEVEGEKIDLCDEYEVLDTLEKAIMIEGLVATDIVTVTIRKSCAIQIKAEKIRR